MVDGLSVAQEPFALMLGCSDARVPTETIFGQDSNDLFVVRVAGNVLGIECLGSIDYAVANMAQHQGRHARPRHTGCGAVTAAVDMYLKPTDYPDLGLSHSLRTIIDRVMIAVRGAARALERVGGSKVSHDRGYRAALLEVAIYLNAAPDRLRPRPPARPGRSTGAWPVVYGVFDITASPSAPGPRVRRGRPSRTSSPPPARPTPSTSSPRRWPTRSSPGGDRQGVPVALGVGCLDKTQIYTDEERSILKKNLF